MKMKLYYGALALLWLLSSCTPSSNVTDNYDKVGTCRNGHIKALTLKWSYILLAKIIGLHMQETVRSVSMNLIV